MGETPLCPDCGSPMAGEGWSEGLCPQCLLRLALQESSDVGAENGEAAIPVGAGSPLRGKILGNRYGIRKFLGRGGMGEVWHAFDLKLRVDIALKMVRPDLAERPRILEALRQEVRAARDVLSPNVCRVYDLQDLEGRELVSMEYVDGTTLRGMLEERGPLGLQEAREIAAQFLAGLDAIHRADLVHRDVKPENIMITRTGRVVVMDFGIARGLAAGRAGTVAGTVPYMAPEQARGEALDARADVFSAGVVLAEMLAPISKREARKALWRGIRQEPPQVPESPWREVIEVAVAPRREQRYAAASALARALEDVTIRVEGAEDVAPYPGLVAFSESNREFFFGRELEAEALWKKIRRLHLLALIGPSGAGKTSFLRAGLLASAPSGWTHVLCTPGDAPFTALRQVLVQQLSGDSDAMRELVKVEDPEAMVSAVSRWRKRGKHALLAVDQFEELFTLNPPNVQVGFATLLGRLAVDADLRVLLSMRDDFLINCYAHEALKPILSELTLLGPPSGAALRRAVVQPALKCGYRFEDEALVDQMLSDVEGERAALPLVAFAAEQLWQRRDRQQGALKRDAYEVIGGVSGALAQHAEMTLERIGTDRAPIVRELFRNLVTAEGTRTAREREELLSVFLAGSDRKAAADVLDALIDARLLTSYGVEATEGMEGRAQRIEIVHESLLTAWPRLVRWKAQDVEGARMRDDLRQAARRWQERNRPRDLLWSGSAYREFQVWRERYSGALSEIEQAYAEAMATHAARGRRRRRLVVGAVIVGLAAFSIVVALSRQQEQAARAKAEAETRRAEAGKLLALGRAHLEDDSTAALAYARASLDLSDTHEARTFAVEALWRGPTARILPMELMAREQGLWDDSTVDTFLALSPDGRWLASLSGSNRRCLLFPRDGGPPRALPLSPDGNARVLAFGPRGEVLVTGGAGESLRFWSLPELREIRSAELGGLSSWGANRGMNLMTVTATADGASLVRYWPLPDGAPKTLGTFRFPGPWALHPSGTSIAYSQGRTIHVRTLEAARPIREWILGSARDDILAVGFAPRGNRLASQDRSGEIRIWSTDGSTAPLNVLEGPPFAFTALKFDAKGSLLIRALPNSDLFLWDLDGPPDSQPVRLGRPGPAYLFVSAFDPGGEWLVASEGTGIIEFWPLGTPRTRAIRGLTSTTWHMAFTHDSRWLATCSLQQPVRLRPLSAEDGQARDLIPDEPCAGLAIHPTRDEVLVGTTRGDVLLAPTKGGPPRRLPGGWGGIAWAEQVAIDPQGRWAVTGAYSSRGFKDPKQRVLRVWDLESGQERIHSVAHLTDPDWEGPRGMRFAPDGSLYIGLEGNAVRVTLPAETGREISSETVLEGQLLDLSRDGRLLLAKTQSDGLLLFDLAEHTSRRITTHGTRVTAAQFNPSGRVIVTGDADGVVRAGPATGEEPYLLLGHEGMISSLAVSPDARWIASATDESIRLWSMPDVTRPPLHSLPHEALLDKLRALTNLEVVKDETASTGYRFEIGPFPGWETMPTW